jgi:hypothetical protein
VIIELAGLEAASLSRLAEIDGVAEVRGDSRAETHQPPGAGLVTVTVGQTSSDAVLRELLTWDGVHVTRVWPAARRPAPGHPEQDLAAGAGTGR